MATPLRLDQTGNGEGTPVASAKRPFQYEMLGGGSPLPTPGSVCRTRNRLSSSVSLCLRSRAAHNPPGRSSYMVRRRKPVCVVSPEYDCVTAVNSARKRGKRVAWAFSIRSSLGSPLLVALAGIAITLLGGLGRVVSEAVQRRCPSIDSAR